MIKAFKTYSQAPIDQIPAGIPLDWVWLIVDILESNKQDFEGSGFTVMTIDEFNQYKSDRQAAFDLWANQYDQDKTSQELRILDLVEDKFTSYHPSKIDFRRHLKPNIYLQKSVTTLPNGRPLYSSYTYQDQLIAEIEFTFEVNQFNFMTRRIEKLSYYKRNGDKSEQWVIADDSYNSNDPYHLREMMKERSEARSMIIEEIKAMSNGVLASYYIPQGKSYGEILVIAGDFWGKYSTSINAWINVGSPKFSQEISVDNEFPFLDVLISPTVTARQYILSKLTY